MERCPVCQNDAESAKWDSKGLRVACSVCGEYLITTECLDHLEFNVKENIILKLRRFLRQSKDAGLRMVSSAPVLVEDRYVRKTVTLQDLRTMYLRRGTEKEYESVLRNCLDLQKKLGVDCVPFDQAIDIFPTVDVRESEVMARKMIAAGDMGSREENGVKCIYVAQAGLDRIS